MSEYQEGAPWCQNIKVAPPGVGISRRRPLVSEYQEGAPWCRNIKVVPPGVGISRWCPLVSEYQGGACPLVERILECQDDGAPWCANIKVAPPGVRISRWRPHSVGMSMWRPLVSEVQGGNKLRWRPLVSQYQGRKQLWLHPLVSGHKGGIRISRFWNLKVEPDPKCWNKRGGTTSKKP